MTTYGRLYQWGAVNDSRSIAPEGWHVPSDAEWKQLEVYLGMSQSEADEVDWRGTDEGGKLKEEGTAHWNEPNEGATNESGFTALPAGCRGDGDVFYGLGQHAYFWSSTVYSNHAWRRSLGTGTSMVFRGCYNQSYAISVRCVRD